jgi:hypothetical protein
VEGVAKVDFGYNVGGGVVWYDSVTIKPHAPVEGAYIMAGLCRPAEQVGWGVLVIGGGSFFVWLCWRGGLSICRLPR